MTRKKDLGHIPKPLNPFICFRRAFSKKVKAERQARASKLQDGSSSGEANKTQEKHVSILAGRAWSALSPEEQAPYILEAAELRRLHELKYPWMQGKGSSAGKKMASASKIAAQRRRGGKGRKPRAPGDLEAVLDSPSANSTVHTVYDMSLGLPDAIVPWQEFLPIPTSFHPSDHDNGLSMRSPHSDVLRLPTPALTSSHGPSPSPVPSDLYSFPPSGNVSRVASPTVLDPTLDDAFYSDLLQPPMASFAAYGEEFPPPEYQIYGYPPSFNGCAPLVPQPLGHIASPAPPAVYDDPFPDPFASESVPTPHPMSLGTEREAAQAGYFWREGPLDQTALIPAFDLIVDQDVQPFTTQYPGSLGTPEVMSLDWLIAHMSSIPPCNDSFVGSSDL